MIKDKFAAIRNALLDRSASRPAVHANADNDLLLPILAAGIGRGGTTLLMLQLGRDPRCLFDRTYAFETLWLSYFVKFAHMLDRTDVAGLDPPGKVTDFNNPSLGILQVPNARAAEDLTIRKEDVFLSLWSSVSQASREHHPGALFYAEKVRVWVPAFVRELMPSYTVYLLRDPRDIVVSQLAFMRKQPAASFGPHASDTARALATSARYIELVENYKQHPRDTCCIVRYEDLVNGPENPLPELQKATGWRPIERLIMDHYERHRSSQSTTESAQRWKRDGLPLEIRTVFETALGGLLGEFGYEFEGIGSPAPPLSLVFEEKGAVKRLSDIYHDHGDFTGCDERGAMLALRGNRFHFDVPLDAEPARRIREIWICLSGGINGHCALSWRGPTEQFSSDRTCRMPYTAGNHVSVLRFPVHEHPAWRGDACGLRLAPFNSEEGLSACCTGYLRWIRAM